MIRPDASRDRGLATGIIIFFAMLAIGAFLYILLNPAVETLLSMLSSQASHPEAQDQISLAGDIWGLILVFVVFLAVLFLLARAIYESGRSV